MGTSTSTAQFARKMQSIAHQLPSSATDGIKASSERAVKTIYQEAARKGVNPSSKIAGGPWGVTSRIKDFKGQPEAFVRITGPFHLVESDTKLHVIAARRLGTRGRVRKRTGEIALAGGGVQFGKLRATERTRRDGTVVQVRGKRALTIGSNARAYAIHRGTRGKRIFAAAKPRIENQSGQVVFDRVVADMKKVLG